MIAVHSFSDFIVYASALGFNQLRFFLAHFDSSNDNCVMIFHVFI